MLVDGHRWGQAACGQVGGAQEEGRAGRQTTGAEARGGASGSRRLRRGVVLEADMRLLPVEEGAGGAAKGGVSRHVAVCGLAWRERAGNRISGTKVC